MSRKANNLLKGTRYLCQSHNQIQAYMIPKSGLLLLDHDVSKTQSDASFWPNAPSYFYT